MSPAISLALLAFASLLSIIGVAAVALSQERNWRNIGVSKAPATWVRPLGWGLIFFALVPCIIRDGFSFTALVWPMLLAAAALVIGMVLAYKPAVMRILFSSLFSRHGSTEI